MSISLEPNKGLRLKLGRFSAIRTWHGGGNFWSHEFQLTVRSGALAEFLPRALEEDDAVLFEYRSGGVEQASASVAIKDMAEIPNRQLKALRAAVEELKRKAEDPHCDRTKRQMIQGFRLPDPQKDRELYRLIGKGATAKLIVLWGLEREEGSALAPGAAVDLLHTSGPEEGEGELPAPERGGRGVLPVLMLLAVMAAGGWYYWHQEKKAAALEAERIAMFNGLAKSGADSDGSKVAMATEGALIKDGEGRVTGVRDKLGAVVPAQTAVKVDAEGKSSPPSAPGTLIKDEKGVVSGVIDKEGKVVAAELGKVTHLVDGKPANASPGAVIRDSKGQVTGVIDKGGKVVSATPGTKADADGKITAGKPGTVFQNSKGMVTGIAGKDGSIVPVKAGAEGSPSSKGEGKGAGSSGEGSQTSAGSGKGGSAGKSGASGKEASSGKSEGGSGSGPGSGPGSSSGSGSLAKGGKPGGSGAGGPMVAGGSKGRDGQGPSLNVGGPGGGASGTSSRLVDGVSKVVAAESGASRAMGNEKATEGTVSTESDAYVRPFESGKQDPTGAAAVAMEVLGTETTPMTTKGPPPTGISSLSVVSTSLSGVLGDGTVEVLVNVVARDLKGAVVAAPSILGWKVNGKMMVKPDGQAAGGPVMPLSLPPGVHRISTVGVGADGKSFETDADVTVSPQR